jgi:hypothetical protein
MQVSPGSHEVGVHPSAAQKPSVVALGSNTHLSVGPVHWSVSWQGEHVSPALDPLLELVPPVLLEPVPEVVPEDVPVLELLAPPPAPDPELALLPQATRGTRRRTLDRNRYAIGRWCLRIPSL